MSEATQATCPTCGAPDVHLFGCCSWACLAEQCDSEKYDLEAERRVEEALADVETWRGLSEGEIPF